MLRQRRVLQQEQRFQRRKLTAAKEVIEIRGERLMGIEGQPIAHKAAKLRLTFSALVSSATQNDPAEELAVLQEVAKQLKEIDHKIRYVHPNWISEIHRTPRRAHRPTARGFLFAPLATYWAVGHRI
jgi:hypothetical protein